MRRRLLVVLFLLTSLTGFSQGTNWTSLNGPYGGNLRDIVKHPNGNIFAVVYNVPGIFRSIDNGTTWTVVELPINDPYINDIEIDASGKIYAIGYSILYASTDLGVNWTTLNSSTGFNNASQIKKTGTNTLYVLAYTDLNGYQAVFKSTNDGTSFTQPYTNTLNTNPINDIAIDGAGDVLLRVAALGS
jgi:photosystem II stability/assembly factor-like uncharacterized protein